MIGTEQQVGIALKMYECRNTARRILGDKFRQMMFDLALVLRTVAERDNCNCIVAGATLIKEESLEGVRAILIMAAVVEMVEPTKSDAVRI